MANARWGRKRWRSGLRGLGVQLYYVPNPRSSVRWSLAISIGARVWEFFNYRTYGL